MTDHDWFRENLSLYAAGALAADECLRMERHAAECAKCAQELAKWRLFDQDLDRLCAPAHFADDWDERVLFKLRVAAKPPMRWSAPARWAVAAAAMIFIGVLGAAVNAVVQQGLIGFPGTGTEIADAQGSLGVDLVGGTITMPSGMYRRQADSAEGGRKPGKGPSEMPALQGWSREGRSDESRGERASQELDALATYNGLIGGKTDPGGNWYENGRKTESEVAAQFTPFGSSVTRNLGANNAVSGLTPSGTLTPDLNVPIKNSSYDFATPPYGGFPGTAAGEKVPDGGKVQMGGLGFGTGTMAPYQYTNQPTSPSGGPVMTDGVANSLSNLEKLQQNYSYGLAMGVQLNDGWARTPATTGADGLAATPPAFRGFVGTDGSVTHLAPPVKVGSFADGLDKAKPNEYPPALSQPSQAGFGNKGQAGALPTGSYGRSGATRAANDAAALHKLSTEYYKLSIADQSKKDPAAQSTPPAATAPARKGEPTLQDAADKLPAKAEDAFLKKLDNNQGPRVVMQSPIALQQKPDPKVAQQKIIRTGELEFEVDSFDSTVAQVNKLIGAIPGAFVGTVNSNKLENGKVKGSIVVRVPPEHLDKFVLDLRQSLAKTGELKTQRIGSQDVTKQYTDIESRLRAARTMEERFLAIIKNGKGEVKDLIAAERELGVWRTKIEEMEGEIRFYNNQVSLSTLTITAFEKEIRAAAAMVITEKVTMKIEADDVEKSLQTALSAVTEAKGRVTKSDLQQHAAGQLEAILLFEVAPAAAGPVKDKLKTLGIVTHHDAQRLQQAEGGAAPAGEAIKSRTNDVQFSVTLYNVANIKPRQEFVLQIAVADVAPEYHRLLDLVLQASGQVRVSQLDEKEKTNINAQLDFDVPSGKRELFDKQLAAIGDIVSRNTTRAGPGESATDRKVGYRLTLKSATSIPPRDTFTVLTYSLEVPAAYKKLQDAALAAKGNVRVTQLDEKDKQNVIAQLEFDVPIASQAAIDKLLDEIGEVASRTTGRLQPNEIASESKIGYKLTLRSQVPPRESLDIVVEVKEVNKTAAEFEAQVRSAKGRVLLSKVTQDAAGRASGTQVFEIPLAAKKDLVQSIRQAGTPRGQDATQNLQAPEGKLATAQIAIRLTSANPIVPSDEGLWPQVRTSLTYAFRLLSVSLMFVIVGISVLLPWALLLWIGVKLVRRMRGKSQASVGV